MSIKISESASVKPPTDAVTNAASIRAGFETATAKVAKQAKQEDTNKNSGNGKDSYQPTEKTLKNTVGLTNHLLESTTCEFAYHKETHMVSITIRDRDTKEVIKEIPPEKSLEMLEKMWEMAGLIVDEKR